MTSTSATDVGSMLDMLVLEERTLYSGTPLASDCPQLNYESYEEVESIWTDVSLGKPGANFDLTHSAVTSDSNISVGDLSAPATLDGQVNAVFDALDKLLAADLASAPVAAPPPSLDYVELIVVDTKVDHADELVKLIQNELPNSAGKHFEIIELEDGNDGIAQITERLRSLNDVGAVHVISHGSNGAIQLGSGYYGIGELAEHSDDFRVWQDALTADADILLYGCEVAGDEIGEQFMREWAALTGADVAASSDLTGHKDLGGDWDLEIYFGSIEAGTLVGVDAQASWLGLLAVPIATDDSARQRSTIRPRQSMSLPMTAI